MGGQWISLGCALLGLAGIYALLRPMRGASALVTTKHLHLHDGLDQGDRCGGAKAVGQSGK